MSAITSTEQTVVNAENAMTDLQLSTLQTGSHFLTINQVVQDNLQQEANSYVDKTTSHGFEKFVHGTFLDGGGVVAFLPIMLGVTATLAPEEWAAFAKPLQGATQLGAGNAMMTEVIGSSFEAHYETVAANMNYKTTVDTNAMKQLTETGGDFGDESNTLSQTEQAIAAALAAEITNKAMAERSTTIYGG